MLLYVFLVLSLAVSAAAVVGTVGFASLHALWVCPLSFVGCYLGLVLLYALVLFLSGVFIDPQKPVENDSPYHRFMLNELARIGFFLGGARVHSTGLEKVPRDGRFLLVSNHVTIFDPLVFLHQLPWAKLGFIAKKEAFGYFLVGPYLRKILCLPIDRENDREALKTILTAIRFVKEDKISVGIFPEGKCNLTDELLLQFRSGAFKIAQKAGIPIVVCCTAGTKHLLRQMFRKRTDLYLDVLDVVPAEEVAGHSTVELAERIYPIMRAGLENRLDVI